MSDDPPDDPNPDEEDDVLFQSAYGVLPKFVLYGVMPFFLFGSGVLLVRAVWFGRGIDIKGVKLSPVLVGYLICPVSLLLCALIFAMAIYRHLHPQRIVITSADLFLPKGRFTDEIIRIPWENLEASVSGARIAFFEVCEVTCLDCVDGPEIKIASTLFPDFDDFATFALIVGWHMGEDWKIKGFLPGVIRGDQEQARLASDKIRCHGGE